MSTFEPPSYPHIITVRRPHFTLTESNSVVRIGGVLTLQKSPSAQQLTTAGQEGVDWFIGGRIYDITNATAAELEVAGFSPRALGYGEGAYGYGPYGG